MPAKMTLQALQNALESKEIDVRSKLDAYAVGIMIDEQHQSFKSVIKDFQELKDQQSQLSPSNPSYQQIHEQLMALQDQPDLGFYHTIILFHELAISHPVESKQMIEAILEFDSMGRYLLEERSLLIDGRPFKLDDILIQQGIDVAFYKAVARHNQTITVFEPLDVPALSPVEKSSVAFSPPDHLDELNEADKLEAMHLYRTAMAVSEMEALQKTVDQCHFDFSLVSKASTKENVSVFIEYLVELFAHAKMQDSSKLDLLTTFIPKDFKGWHHSLVALLGNTLPYWFLFALVQSPTVEIFTQRLEFILSVFSELNRATPHLPSHANADIYLPFLVLSSMFQRSILQYHPAMKPYWQKMQTVSHLHNAMSIHNYMHKHMHFFVNGNTVELPSMRMFMLAQLEIKKELSFLSSKTQEPALCKIQNTIKNGEFVYEYFYPPLSGSSIPLERLSENARTIFNAQAQIQLLTSKSSLRTEIKGLLLSAFPLYKETDSFHEKLHALESVLLAESPRVFFYEKHFFRRVLRCLKDDDAFDFVELQIKKILDQAKILETPVSKAEIEKWCSAILEKLPLNPLKKWESAPAMFSIATPPSTPETPRKRSMSLETRLHNLGLFKQNTPSSSAIQDSAPQTLNRK